MVGPAPQIKPYDAPLAARPIPIRTGSFSPPPPPSPARSSRTAGLKQATSVLGMRGISHLRSLTMPQKVTFAARRNGGSSISSGSSGAGSRKGRAKRPLAIGKPFFKDERCDDTAAGLPRRMCAVEAEVASAGSPALQPRPSIVRMPFLDRDEFEKLQACASSIPEHAEMQQAEDDQQAKVIYGIHAKHTRSISSARRKSAVCPRDKRGGGVEMWNVVLDVDQDALQDALDEQPSPLGSHPTLSDRDEDEPITPWAEVSCCPDLGTTEEECNPYWGAAPSPTRKQRSRSFALSGHAAPIFSGPDLASSSRGSAHSHSTKSSGREDILTQLSRDTAKRAGNSALSTLQASYQETIQLLHEKIQKNDNEIANLTWQLRVKDTEQLCLVESFYAEMSSQNQRIEALHQDKCYLMGEIDQLEKLKVAAVGGAAGLGDEDAGARGGSDTRKGVELDVEHGFGGIAEDRKCSSVTSWFSEAPPYDQPKSSNVDCQTSATMLRSRFSSSPRSSSSSSSSSNHSLCTARSMPSVRERPSPRMIKDGHDEARPLRCQQRESGQSWLTNNHQAGSSTVRDNDKSQKSGIKAVQIVLAAKAEAEQQLSSAQAKLAAAEARSQKLRAQLDDRATLFQHMPRTPQGTWSISSALMPIPDLPVLTYNTASNVWIDRITTSFKYLGLSDFIQRDVPRPETSTWDATEVTYWTSRRLRAVVLLKHAVSDEILEDVLHLCGRMEGATCQRFDGYAAALEDPHQLFTTIACLRRLISSSALDISWLDRIEGTDFCGFEGFTSLVLCIDKRHGAMYGTSAEHYDALIPKVQETEARLFPSRDGASVVRVPGSTPRTWLQLSIWMAKVVKRRQISGDC